MNARQRRVAWRHHRERCRLLHFTSHLLEEVISSRGPDGALPMDETPYPFEVQKAFTRLIDIGWTKHKPDADSRRRVAAWCWRLRTYRALRSTKQRRRLRQARALLVPLGLDTTTGTK